VVRAVIYFAIWNIWAFVMWTGSAKYDRTGDPHLVAPHAEMVCAGPDPYFLTMTGAAVDWIMTRESHWYSSIIGLVIVVSRGLSAMALALAVLRVAQHSQPLGAFVTPARLNDLASLFLSMIILWGVHVVCAAADHLDGQHRNRQPLVHPPRVQRRPQCAALVEGDRAVSGPVPFLGSVFHPADPRQQAPPSASCRCWECC
jgi:hypothetical protein